MNDKNMKQQYLKYKNKYLNQKSGAKSTIMISSPKCPNFGFTNLNDTCSINSLLMIILYSDTLKEIIQPKLNEISSYDINIF
jgi:hypothetical protein